MPNKKRILFTSHTANFQKFNRPFMRMLRGTLEAPYDDLNIGEWEVDYASANEEKIFDADNVYKIDFARSPFRIDKHLKAFFQLKKILKNNHYDIIHTHTPVGSVITRLAARKARKSGTKVVYTSHGFHFYKGAPKKYWFIFYPVEKYCARFTDLLITINEEDYACAKKNFHTHVELLNGVGVDASKIDSKISESQKKQIRKEIGLKNSDFAIAYTAEFTPSKNHRFLFDSLHETLLDNPSIKIILLGKGELMSKMKTYAKELKISKQVIFLGYRSDVYRVLQSCDLAVSPSSREGLGLGVIEAQLCGLPILIANNRGHREIADKNEKVLFSLEHPEEFAQKVKKAYLKTEDYYIPFNSKFSLRSALAKMRKFYSEYSK